MAVEVTLGVSPTTQQQENPLEFSGRVTEDGVPMIGLSVNVFEVAGDEFLVAAETDDDGYYLVEWTPDSTWVGTYEVRTLAAAFEGFWSDKVKIKVTNGVVSMDLVWGIGVPVVVGGSMILFYAMKRRGKK